MNKDKQKLRQFRKEISKIMPELKRAVPARARQNIPTTFDVMMTDFGTRVQRQVNDERFAAVSHKILSKVPKEEKTIEADVKSAAEVVKQMVESSSPQQSYSVESELYLRIKERERLKHRKYLKQALQKMFVSRHYFPKQEFTRYPENYRKLAEEEVGRFLKRSLSNQSITPRVHRVKEKTTTALEVSRSRTNLRDYLVDEEPPLVESPARSRHSLPRISSLNSVS